MSPPLEKGQKERERTRIIPLFLTTQYIYSIFSKNLEKSLKYEFQITSRIEENLADSSNFWYVFKQQGEKSNIFNFIKLYMSMYVKKENITWEFYLTMIKGGIYISSYRIVFLHLTRHNIFESRMMITF